MNKRTYLVQRKAWDGEPYYSIMQANELIGYINMADCHDEHFSIWDITEFGKVEPCHYTGWQPNCLIEVVRDSDGEVILRGYGEDH